MSTFGERLKQLRDEKGFTIRAMADFIGSTRSKVWRYEKGDEPDINFVRSVAVKFNVSMDWLSGDSENRHISLITMKEIPECSHIAQGYFDVIQEAYESGLTPEEIREILKIAGKLKRK